MIVSVIGGTSGFGLWTANFVKKHFPQFDVIVTGRNEEKGKAVSKKHNLLFTTDNIEATKQADVLIFSVPISHMEETIKQLAPYAKDDAVVMDVCSIKQFPTETMKKYSPKNVLVIPIHPMFGPYIEDIAGQIFVFTVDDEAKKDKRYIKLKEFLSREGAKIIETTALHHDKLMAVVQGLTHINMFTVGETIKRLGISVEETLNFVSPIYKLLIASVARYVGHDPHLYGDIQIYNKQVLSVHNVYMDVIKDFNSIVQKKDKSDFVETIKRTNEYFGENMTSFGQKYTDKIVYLMTHQLKTINENIGKKLKFKNIYSGEEKEGIVMGIKDNIVFFEGGTKLDINEYII